MRGQPPFQVIRTVEIQQGIRQIQQLVRGKLLHPGRGGSAERATPPGKLP
jgi:hypothetical protein